MKRVSSLFAGFILCLVSPLKAQIEVTQDLAIDHFLAEIEVTNNGISPIPAFTLGEPALIATMNFGKKRFSVSPMISLALKNVKPWSVGVWVRYNLVEEDYFTLRVGTNPSVNFQVSNYLNQGQPIELIESRRYLGSEIAPIFTVLRKWKVGIYYLRAYGFDEGPKNGHFFGFNTSLDRLRLSRYFYFSLVPQVFHVRIDDASGYYASGNLRIHFSDSPFILSTTMNKALKTELGPEGEFIWNISLIYRID
jgi:hypothetical protein